ncbi:ribulose-phosphate 3-epimerase [Spiroplasma corruscae]|uniref:Ribulose-phosphate 3-epimerase n=1 Tax=Spiroplasma corruscae TaxID=216934 RepID=A0A222ENU0_9MOLU|nr:ribulose-phosphate 3-epimerase [Spiroplasma corruscae]ASP27954.1 ribulose-phosphate 3-epimerase [Spiroplasma corruscae]
MSNKIAAASILTANFLELNKELNKLKDSKVKWIHYDVMDYNFVPNLSFGTKILKDICDNFNFNIDIHFMVRLDDKWCVNNYLDSFYHNNVKQFTFHIESILENKMKLISNYCKEKGINFSIAINPDTDVQKLTSYLEIIDNVLVMSVNPGFGGQSFIINTLKKIEQLYKIRQKNHLSYSIQVDGGINNQTIDIVKKAGADVLVAGSYLLNNNLSIDEIKKRVIEIEK